jgi:hypothetical protein
MSLPHLDVWRVAKHYLNDNRPIVGEELYNLLHGWIRSRNYQQLSECSTLIDISFADVEIVSAMLQLEAFFKKNDAFTSAIAAAQKAVSSFHRAEKICRITNKRLDHYLRDGVEIRNPRAAAMVDLCHNIRGFIAKTLGPVDEFTTRIPDLVGVTNGATSVRSRRQSHASGKVRLNSPVTPGCAPLKDALLLYMDPWLLLKRKERITNVNRIEFVPKSWKTHRTIACEPEGNMPFQLACDKFLKRKLCSVGIDLRDQSTNQRLCREGSISGELATVDLSMASDTVAYNLIWGLFPEEWAEMLTRLRTPFGKCNGSSKTGVAPFRVKYAKFSSMGNGATFPIETLIFLACCRAVGDTEASVYGDDIIIKSSLVPRLYELLRFLGFTPNAEKSFHTGFFRESCGAYFVKGCDVTPFYMRTVPRLKPHICLVINSMRSRMGPHSETMRYLDSFIQKARLLQVPYNEDACSGVWVTPSTCYENKLLRYNRTCDNQNRYYDLQYQSYKPKRLKKRSRPYGAYYLTLHRPGGNAKSVEELLKEARQSGNHNALVFSEKDAGSVRYRTSWTTWREPVCTPLWLYNS